MVIEIKRQVELIIERVIAYADEQYKDDDKALFKQFIGLYYLHAPTLDLSERSAPHLYGLVYNHWLLFRVSNLKNCDLVFSLYNPSKSSHGWDSTHTILQLVLEDMPFVVDSIRMEIDRLTMTNYLMIFTGGIWVLRDSKDRVVKLCSRDSFDDNNTDAGWKIESPIHVEIGCHTDQKKLQLLKSNIERVMLDVSSVTRDWGAMCKQVEVTIDSLKLHAESVDEDEVEETISYLRWLLDDHFTFFGMRDYSVNELKGEKTLDLVVGSGLGVLQDDEHSKKMRYFHELSEEVQKMMLSNKHILVISKTNTLSTVHRVGYTDYIGIKRFDDSGNLLGERRFIGLYTSLAYESAPESIPLLRKKVLNVLAKSGFPQRSHSCKDLMHILRTLPRDDLFQSSVNELLDLSLGILHIQERRQVRLFVRRDVYGRFMSCLIFVPRESFSSGLITSMQRILMAGFHGVDSSFTTHFSSSVLAQIHFVIRLNRELDNNYDIEKIERDIILSSLSWNNRLRTSIIEFFGEERGLHLADKYADTFQSGYRERFLPAHAVDDIAYIESLNENQVLAMNAYYVQDQEMFTIGFKLYRKHNTVPLSDALPMLENLGLRVIGEEPFQLTFADGEQVWINDLHMEYKNKSVYNFDEVREHFQDCFYHVWLDDAENDYFNALALAAKLTWREIILLRAYALYFKQIRMTFSLKYIAETLVRNTTIVVLLVEMFLVKFNPGENQNSRLHAVQVLHDKIISLLDNVKVLDEDRILRKYLFLINASVRTNYFQTDKGDFKSYLSLKFDPSQVPGFPLPVPVSEIFVYSPRVEGVHIRFDRVARGGLRWSNRREDYRTEVLGLSKAQQVKNSIIIPAGAKGGFITKSMSVITDREKIIEEGIACYKIFINGLLDCVDNITKDKVVSPDSFIAYDGDDPYLVVAADKGTATFSDFANAVSTSRDYWLGDAFASGGETGYDHKKIGITARGAWVSAERHFQELGIKLNEAEITVTGIGDMAGDVFGNGMLISDKIKLVAAFNHMHIFIDPNPDPRTSFEERLRLFNMPRSLWSDYNKNAMSKGAAIFSRSEKELVLTKQIKQLLNITADKIVPNDLIKAILCAEVDMIWNGGIGTFVKSTQETDLQVGDRSNNAIRVNASDLSTRVVCEGGNLGMTQLARIEFANLSGSINTDFIDNSAGVDCSDHEVNIKIMLNRVVADARMTVKQRNQLLKKMTDDVAVLVLQDNYQQNRLIGQCYHSSPYYLSLYDSFIKHYDKAGEINRKLEFLPNSEDLAERRKKNIGLNKPELSVLISHAKIIIEKQLRGSSFLKNEFYQQYVLDYFPLVIKRKYADDILNHRLYREILSTSLSNMLVSDMGFAYVFQLQQELDISIEKIINAYLVAREIFSMQDIYAEIHSHDYIIPANVQYQMSEVLVRLIRRATRWILFNYEQTTSVVDLIEKFKANINTLFKKTSQYLIENDKDSFHQRRQSLIEAGVSDGLSDKIALLPNMYHSLLIIDSAQKSDNNVLQVAKVYFKIIQRLDLIWLREVINKYPVANQWVALAKTNCKFDLDKVQSQLAITFINFDSSAKTLPAKMKSWLEYHAAFFTQWQTILGDLHDAHSIDFAMLTVAIKQLVNFAEMCQ